MVVLTVPVAAAEPVDGEPLLNPSNGHFYEAVEVVGGIGWFDAKTAAASRSFSGVPGHLVTITSAQEDNFIATNFPEAFPVVPLPREPGCEGPTTEPNSCGFPYWFGGFQPSGSPLGDPAGDWEWVTGEPFDYTNWADGEPNDFNGREEDCLDPHSAGSLWNDSSCDDRRIGGYVVEFDTVSPLVGLVDPLQGQWHLRTSAGGVTSFYFGNPGDVPVMGDWDCDGVDTPGMYRQSDGFVYLRNSNTEGIANIRFFFGDPSDVPLAGDFNGDGCDTLSIYRPSEARFYIMNELGENEGGLGAADFSFLFGNQGDKPVVGDWDGDGIDEIGLHRETTGFFYYRNTLTTGVADGQFFFGDPGDRFVAGDWGVVDSVDTPAMFRPSNNTFYFRHTLTEGNADSQFVWTGAGSSWLPVAGDFTTD
jgi:hypothetical protein